MDAPIRGSVDAAIRGGKSMFVGVKDAVIDSYLPLRTAFQEGAA